MTLVYIINLSIQSADGVVTCFLQQLFGKYKL